MSEYNVVNLEIKDADCLQLALQELGFKPEIHAEPQNLIGWHSDIRPQQAHIIVRRNQINTASNDVGFFKQADGNYQLIISDFDQCIEMGQMFTQKLKQVYAKHVALKQVKRMGYTCASQTVKSDGKLVLRIFAR